jgi:hypothetical protein
MIVPLGGPERQPGDEAPAAGQAVAATPRPLPWVDAREALYGDRCIGTAGQVQLPREAVTRLHGLVVDLDANLLQPNPWFPPAATPEAFAATIAPALARHPVLCHAEVRDTGRWLHAIVRGRGAALPELRAGAGPVAGGRGLSGTAGETERTLPSPRTG